MFNDELIGKQIGEFVVQERIGEGGMATVYRAYQKSVNRDIALKVINLYHVSDPAEFLARFSNEAEIIASLEHLHILPVHAYGIQENIVYLAMRLLRGESLKEIVRKENLPYERVAAIFSQVASGLSYAHSKGVIHRDLKLGNILLDESGNAFLTDFGLAKLISGDRADLTKSGNVMGTLTYMSPEQLRGEKLGPQSDIYSLGIVLYHTVCGQPPFEQSSDSDVVGLIYKHLEAPPPPTSINPNIPPAMEAVILKALAKSPDERYDSAVEMAQALQLSLGLSGTPMALPEPEVIYGESTLRTESPRRAGRRLAIGGTALAAALLLVALFTAGPLAGLFAPAPTSAVHTIQRDRTLSPQEIVPTDAQIAAARAALGEEGFIALMACNMSSEYHATQNREMVELANEYGLATRIYDSDSESYEQRLNLERALVEGAAAVVLCPLDFDLLDEPLQSIRERRLPLTIFADPDVDYGGVILASTADNYEMGRIVGQFMGQYAAQHNLSIAQVIILDFPDLSTIVERADGMADGLRELAPNSRIIGRYLGGTQQNAYNSVRRLVESGVNFNMILSINDAGAYGAINALTEYGIRPDEVAIGSIDAERLAIRYIREGRFIAASLSVGRRESAHAAIQLIALMLAGESVPGRISIPSNELVTKETLTQIGR